MSGEIQKDIKLSQECEGCKKEGMEAVYCPTLPFVPEKLLHLAHCYNDYYKMREEDQENGKYRSGGQYVLKKDIEHKRGPKTASDPGHSRKR